MNRLIYLSLVTIPLLLSAENVTLEPIKVNSQESNGTSATNYDYIPFQKEGYMKSAPMQKQITTKQALEIAGSNGDPIKALKSIAGVVSTNNDDGSELYIHGSKPRETRFSINHLPVGYLFHLGGLHSVIAPEMIDQMDAYLGGFDVTYGAMGAVVDITPKYPTGSGKGRVHVGLYDADFAYDMSLGENTNLFISARRSYFDLIADKILDDLNSDDDDPTKKTTFTLFPQFYDAQMILSHTVGNHLFSLEALMAEDELKINDTFNKNKDPIAVGKINSKRNSNTVGLRWQYLGDDVTSNTLLYRLYTKANLELFDADYFVDSSRTEFGLYHETIWNLDNHTVTLGTQLQQTDSPVKVNITAPTVNDYDAPITGREVVEFDKIFSSKSYTLFAQDIWDITPNDHFRYGVRAWKTDFQNFGSGIDPRIAYVHDFSKDFSISMAVGRYSQLPSTLRVIEGFGNEKIDTNEFADHYSMSFQKRFNDTTSLVVEPYYKKFQNLAINDDLTKYESVGEGEAYGVDITYQKKIDDFDIIVAYTYVKATRQIYSNNNKQYSFEGDIPHTLQINTNYHFWDTWRISSFIKYNSGAPYTPIVDTQRYTHEGKEYTSPIYGNPYSKRLDANYDVDIQIGKTTKYADGTSLEYALELMNINALFKRNIDSISYDDNYEEDGTTEQFGFLPALHVTYRF